VRYSDPYGIDFPIPDRQKERAYLVAAGHSVPVMFKSINQAPLLQAM
jgi:hypothetical protein